MSGPGSVAMLLDFDRRTLAASCRALVPLESVSDSHLAPVYLSACDPSVISSVSFPTSTEKSDKNLPAYPRSVFHVPSPQLSRTASPPDTIEKPTTVSPCLPAASPVPFPRRNTFPSSQFTSASPHTPIDESPANSYTFAQEPKPKQKKKYKPVAKKIKLLVTDLPACFRIQRSIHGDPLSAMPTLATRPPPFVPTGRYTQARRDRLREDHSAFLRPAELDLLDDFMCKHERAFAWDDSERGRFRKDFFPPIEFPVVAHTPWVLKNIPIPPGIYKEVCAIIKEKIDAGVYEPSNSSYRSRWFCVLKKDGKSLRIVHSLEPLNAVTIDRKSTRLNSSHSGESRMPSSA